MHVKVKYISVIAGITGRESEIVELDEAADIAGLAAFLCERHGARFRDLIFISARNRKHLVNFIVNNRTVGDDYRLTDGAEITIVLALGGG